ncbi:Hypothetical protein PBC10988_35880 [Planctomycetales bacterium 10988]|nr:Hypothetical protein PBC10988_35880 [Planctomycetales bacterium 10988]
MEARRTIRPAKVWLAVWLLSAWFPGLIASGIMAGGISMLPLIPADWQEMISFLPEEVKEMHPLWCGMASGLVVGVLANIMAVFRFFSVKYEIESTSIQTYAGFLWCVRRSLALDQLSRIEIRRGPVERILGLGRLYLHGVHSSPDSSEELLFAIRDPYRVKEELLEFALAARQKLGRSETIPMSAGEPSREHLQMLNLLQKILFTLRSIEGKLEDQHRRAG